MEVIIFEGDLSPELTEYYCNENFIGVDVETSALSDTGELLSFKDKTAGLRALEPSTALLSLIQLSDEKGSKVVFIRKPNVNSFNLKKVLTCSNVKIIHYAIFDDTIIFSKLGYHCVNMFCTRTLAKMVLPDESSSLMNLSLKFFNDSFKFNGDKRFIDTIHHWECELSEEQINYAAKDVAILGKLRLELVSLATDIQLKYLESAMRLIPSVINEHRRGIFLKVGMLNVEDLFGTARKWGDNGRSS